MSRIDDFNKFRQKMNEEILNRGTINTKRFFNLDSNVYKEGKLSKKTKELIGLCASTVLRCDDCISYHLLELQKIGVTTNELIECFDVSLVIGGSVTIPHIRRAMKIIIESKKDKGEKDEKE